ncbi:MAG: hypothetical protein D6791_14175 [Chloroflexi bacterium]|nr:MAG: hypothetical protein D6791_14175 [Chloroflexota bacterium]
MRYLPELYYLQDRPDFPLRHAIQVTATGVALWCDYYLARVIAPREPRPAPGEKHGRLPSSPVEKEAVVGDLLRWLWDSSEVEDLFCLLLDDRPLPRPRPCSRFDHHDDTCCWVLDLTAEQFAILQQRWREHGLPADLFYPEREMRCVPWPGERKRDRALRALGAQKCYTPRQWQLAQQAGGC